MPGSGRCCGPTRLDATERSKSMLSFRSTTGRSWENPFSHSEWYPPLPQERVTSASSRPTSSKTPRLTIFGIMWVFSLREAFFLAECASIL